MSPCGHSSTPFHRPCLLRPPSLQEAPPSSVLHLVCPVGFGAPLDLTLCVVTSPPLLALCFLPPAFVCRKSRPASEVLPAGPRWQGRRPPPLSGRLETSEPSAEQPPPSSSLKSENPHLDSCWRGDGGHVKSHERSDNGSNLGNNTSASKLLRSGFFVGRGGLLG